MDGSEREIFVKERAYRIVGDERALTAYASFVEAQLRYRRIRGMLTWLRTLTGGTLTLDGNSLEMDWTTSELLSGAQNGTCNVTQAGTLARQPS